jgi:hypothetical protein
MTDMRVIFAIILVVLLSVGLLVCKAVAISFGWILWPLAILAIVGSFILFLLSGWSA